LLSFKSLSTSQQFRAKNHRQEEKLLGTANTLPWRLELGASLSNASSVDFRVWAPSAHSLAVKISGSVGEPFPLTQDATGYWTGTVPDISPGTRYQYLIDQTIERPDPASRSQPAGVHGPSEIIDPSAFSWTDRQWGGIPLGHYIIYELHTGTFTPEGTFDAMISRLPYLRDRLASPLLNSSLWRNAPEPEIGDTMEFISLLPNIALVARRVSSDSWMPVMQPVSP
jgi:1,4-alpha-glucan branching enzyme